MKEQLKLLRHVQSIDLYLDERHKAKAAIQQQLLEHKGMLQALSNDIEAQRNELAETVDLKTRREAELAEGMERHASSKERLMNVSSTKEYNAVEKEMEGLKKKADETREQLEHLKEAIEVNQRYLGEKEEKIADLTRQIEEVERDAEGKIAILDKQIAQFGDRLKEARSQLKQGPLRRYDFIRTRRGGQAIVAAKDGYCTGCFMSLPPQLYITIQRGSTLEICPSCQRILYFHGDAEGETTEAQAEA